MSSKMFPSHFGFDSTFIPAEDVDAQGTSDCPDAVKDFLRFMALRFAPKSSVDSLNLSSRSFI